MRFAEWFTLGCLSLIGGFSATAMAQDLRIEHVTIVSPERASPVPDDVLAQTFTD